MVTTSPSVEQINRRIGFLHERIQLIANRTADMALLGIADERNPTFAVLMQERESHLEKVGKLVAEAEKLLGINRP